MLQGGATDSSDWGDDLVLAGEAAAGVAGAWEAIVDRYGGIVYSLIVRRGFRDERDDLSQEIFFLIWKRIGTFRGHASLKTWVYQVAVNHLRNHAARRVPARAVELREADLVSGEAPSPLDRAVSRDDPATALEQKRQAAAVRDALNDIPVVYREVLLLREIDGLNYEEIAAILHVPVGTVRSRLSRARHALACILRERGVLP